MPNDQRLIEDYIPIEAISEEARREKSIRKGHISTLHLWWARRPLVAARAAVYGALVPAPTDKKGRREAEEFVKRLCKYPGDPHVVAEARRHIWQAHAARLTAEQGHLVTAEDIEAGRAPRPRVLDMFAGGGAIPLEALRLGCEAYALDLNPVAHIIELCTLVYPQQYGAPDPAARGSAKDGTWAGLAAEVEYWGKWVLEKARADIGDLYPPIPDPDYKPTGQLSMDIPVAQVANLRYEQPGMLTPVAYLWTRTVRCKNPSCGGTVPLARQTWLAQKPGRYVALRPDANANAHRAWPEKTVRYRVVEATTENGLGFDPAGGSRGGNVACPFCGTVADSGYVKAEGMAGRIGVQPMAVACTRPGKQGKVYLAVEEVSPSIWPDDDAIVRRVSALQDAAANDTKGPLIALDEPIEANPRSMDVQNYGLLYWDDLYTRRQALALLTFAKYVRNAHDAISRSYYSPQHVRAITTFLGIVQSRLADFANALCTLLPSGGRGVKQLFVRQALPMVWDFAETNPFNPSAASWPSMLSTVIVALEPLCKLDNHVTVARGSSTSTSYGCDLFDAIVTDPPYYDNVSYSNLADFFYVWQKRTIGFLYPEDFASALSPKKKEAIAASYRHEGGKRAAQQFYENTMAKVFSEASRILKPNALMVIVYAHKTTLGWSTLVNALRSASFAVTEAWPLETEQSHRTRAVDNASLASSIFLVARKRLAEEVASYEHDVRPNLDRIVRERVERLWAQGVTGADLVIACVGAGLRAFTRFGRVEYANGEEVPASTYLAEVEGAVLEALLERLFGVGQSGVASVDAVTRFYVLWRYAYRSAAVDAGEAILFAYPLQVELDGPGGLSQGSNALLARAGSRYYLRDYMDRGAYEDLGKPTPHGSAPIIDVLHRVLWLMDYRPSELPAFLDEAQPDLDRLRVTAQALAGPALSGGAGKAPAAGETAALRRLTANWRTLIEENLFRDR